METIFSGDVIMVWIYNIAILAGTAYLVQVFEWNPWWFLFTMCCMMSETKHPKCKCKKEEPKSRIIID